VTQEVKTCNSELLFYTIWSKFRPGEYSLVTVRNANLWIKINFIFTFESIQSKADKQLAINWYTKLIHFNFACLDCLHSIRHPCIWIRGHQSQAAINMCLNVLRLISITGPLILWVCFELSKYSKYFEFTNSRSLMRKRWHS